MADQPVFDQTVANQLGQLISMQQALIGITDQMRLAAQNDVNIDAAIAQNSATIANFAQLNNGLLDFIRIVLTTGIVTYRSPDQDVVFDHENGRRKTVTVQQPVEIPVPAGCKSMRFSTTTEVYVTTNGDSTPSDDGTAILVRTNTTELLPVTPGVSVWAVSATASGVVRAVPTKVR